MIRVSRQLREHNLKISKSTLYQLLLPLALGILTLAMGGLLCIGIISSKDYLYIYSMKSIGEKTCHCTVLL